MIQIKNKYYYDSKFDDLTVKIKDHGEIYSEEIYNDIYLYYSEEDDSVVGAQILYWSKRADKVLKDYLPIEIYEAISNLKKDII